MSGGGVRPPAGELGRVLIQSSNTGEEIELAVNVSTGEIDADSYRRFAISCAVSIPAPRRRSIRAHRPAVSNLAANAATDPARLGVPRADVLARAAQLPHPGHGGGYPHPGNDGAHGRDLAESMGVHGLGYYPVSGFIHVDVRDERMRWTDYGMNRFDSERTEHGSAQGEVAEPDVESSETSSPRTPPTAKRCRHRRWAARLSRRPRPAAEPQPVVSAGSHTPPFSSARARQADDRRAA